MRKIVIGIVLALLLLYPSTLSASVPIVVVDAEDVELRCESTAIVKNTVERLVERAKAELAMCGEVQEDGRCVAELFVYMRLNDLLKDATKWAALPYDECASL